VHCGLPCLRHQASGPDTSSGSSCGSSCGSIGSSGGASNGSSSTRGVLQGSSRAGTRLSCMGLPDMAPDGTTSPAEASQVPTRSCMCSCCAGRSVVGQNSSPGQEQKQLSHGLDIQQQQQQQQAWRAEMLLEHQPWEGAVSPVAACTCWTTAWDHEGVCGQGQTGRSHWTGTSPGQPCQSEKSRYLPDCCGSSSSHCGSNSNSSGASGGAISRTQGQGRGTSSSRGASGAWSNQARVVHILKISH
jgi:hypothetical protein